jgi:hypothetical protein
VYVPDDAEPIWNSLEPTDGVGVGEVDMVGEMVGVIVTVLVTDGVMEIDLVTDGVTVMVFVGV